jgi:dipeptidyl aminopeptidase/acylaminoacyl peptidase
MAGFAAPAPRVIDAAAADFTLEQALDFPFPDHLIASPTGSTIAWTFAERGVRNIYVAAAPDFSARRVTPYTEDDGQELTNLAFSPDGGRIVYVRGGDHGANWPAEGNLQPNPNSSPSQPRMQVWSVSVAGGAPVVLGDGDEPAIAPAGGRVAFVNNHRIWTAPLDGAAPAEQAFFARGSSESPRWSPDGRTLAFVSNRDDHSFIGLFVDPETPVRYLSPTTSRDVDPVWSADGRTIAFIRMPGRGGAPRSPLRQPPQPWAIWIARADGSEPARQVWQSGPSLVDSVPRTADDRNLRWAADGRLVFFSNQDGWQHLYSLPIGATSSARATLLTPGAFMVEHVALTPDARHIVYSANTGGDRLDIDRRHLFKVAVDGAGAPAAVTGGTSLEWAPVATGDGQRIAFLSSEARRPPLPAIVPVAGGTPNSIAADHIPAAFPPAGQLVTPEPVVFTSADGLEIHAQLFKAERTSADVKRPALVYVHGGPPRQMLLGWHYMDYYANDYAANQYLASRGFIVLAVNYRLGIGYGHAFQHPERGGARGAAEYADVLAAGKYLQSRADVDRRRVGIWGGSYGGYLTALALGRNSDVFAAGVDIHGVHDRIPAVNTELLARAMVGDGITESDYRQALKVAYESSPISSVGSWKSPVLLIHGDDDRNVQFNQTVELKQRLLENGVAVEELVIPDDIHDFLLWRSWRAATSAAGAFFERQFMSRPPGSQP